MGAGDVRRPERVQDRLVVLVHQDDHPRAGALVQRLDQPAETDGCAAVAGSDAHPLLEVRELRRHLFAQIVRLLVVAAAEVQTHHRMADGPIPAAVDLQPLEQRLVALEQLLQRIHEQTLAEAPRARQEVVLAFPGQPLRVGGLVDVVPAALADLAEGPESDGELALRHGLTIAQSPAAVKLGGGREPLPPWYPHSRANAPRG